MNSLQRCKPLLGTFVEVSVQDNVSDRALLAQSNVVFEQIEKIEKMMNFHHADSELSHINRNAHHTSLQISQDMTTVIDQALVLSYLTDGIYDISVAGDLVRGGLLNDYDYLNDPVADWKNIVMNGNNIYFNRPLTLDLGGIAKGYAVDKALAVSDDNCQIVVNAGGDLKMSHWQDKQVSIRRPNSPVTQTIELEMQAAAVATSGHYFLDGEVVIINAKNKQQADKRSSVSVFSNSCMLADALTKVDFLYDDSRSVLSAFQAKAVRIDRHGEVLM